ncbi:hypothetical protein ACLOJK_015606 [Asimina triloba]
MLRTRGYETPREETIDLQGMDYIAEAVLSFSVSRLGDQLNQEANSLVGVGNDLEWVEGQFRWMEAFIKDAEAKSDQDERVKNWIQEVRILAYQAEDIIDTFLVEIALSTGALGTIGNFNARRKLASEIERMKVRIHSISESREFYGIESITASTAGQSSREQGTLSPHGEEPHFVGFQAELEKLMQQLAQGEQRRSVVSIVGMGGQGKTTLARKLYQNDAVRRHFHPCLWISVSQVHDLRELLLVVMKRCIGRSNRNVCADELREKIAEHLRGKRYLIVLDDVWTFGAWDGIKDAFPSTSNGSKVLLTTRNRDVALHADPISEPHELRGLDEDESWELFLKKAFSGGDANFSIDPQHLRREIFRKCQGIPLAIVIIGGLLSRRTEPREWKNILKSIAWQLIEGEDRMSGILSLSYRDLPYYLKPCFLYLGIFPPDYEIPAKKLIQLWVAEGFLKERGALTLEEVGEECLHELLRRSLIHVAAKSSSGAIKSCRIHGVSRDFAVSKAEEDVFLEVHSSASASKPCKGRRLAVHHAERFDFLNRFISNLRSLLIHNGGVHRLIGDKEEKLICGSFKLLRVLDMEGVEVEKLPSEIGELVHLKYLGFAVRSKTLPTNVANLFNLQTLCMSNSLGHIRIPVSVLEMQQLRHVRVAGNQCWIETEGRPGFGQLWSSSSLQTLENVVATEWMTDGCLGSLTKLRKLGIDIYLMPYRGSVERIWKSITTMESLESLYARTRYGSLGQVPSLNHLPNLCKLKLEGRIENPPLLGGLPTYLTKLILEESCLEQDPVPSLEKLEHLRILSLGKNSYKGEKITCSVNGFPRLKCLKLENLPCLREWIVEKRSMPCLLDLVLGPCSNLKEVPDLQHVPTLKRFQVSNMNSEFKDKIQQYIGKDWSKVQHISSPKGLLYDGKTGEQIGELSAEDGHKGSIYAASWSPDSKQVLTVSADKTAKIWEIAEDGNGKVHKTLSRPGSGGADDMLVGCLWQNDYLVTGSLGGMITVFSASDLDKEPVSFSGHIKSASALAVLPQGSQKTILSSSYDGLIVRWIKGIGYSGKLERKDNSQIKCFVTAEEELVTYAFDNKVKRIPLQGDQCGEVETIDVGAQPKDVNLAPQCPGLALVSTEMGVVMLRGPKVVSTIKLGYAVAASAIAPDGTEAIIGGQDGNLHIYSVSGDTLTEERVLEKHRGNL